MISWESQLIDRIHPDVAPLLAVEDADGLFRSDKVTRLLADRGADVVLFDDPLMFRYFYEAEMRSRLEAGEPCCYVIVLDEHPEGFRRLPADVYQACRKLEVALGDVFPKLSRKVLKELEPMILSRLWEKKDQIPGHTLSDRETADLILRLGFRIEPTLIEDFTDLIRYLTELHFNGQHLPEAIVARLEQIGASITGKPSNIGEIIRVPARFWEFMQVEWETWLVGEDKLKDRLHDRVPFEDNRIRVFVDNLFTEGFLSPVTLPPSCSKLPVEWCRIGVADQSAKLASNVLIQQREALAKTLPDEDASYQDWLRFANRYSSHVAAWFAADRPQAKTAEFWDQFWLPMDKQFQQWVVRNLDGLHNLPPTRPVVTHHIPKFLARKVSAGDKVVLLVLDGLSFSQWKLLKPELDSAHDDILIGEDLCFTLLPSITNVCRQAIYSGELPIYFEKTIARTDTDGKRWKSWWDGALPRVTRGHHLVVQGQHSDLSVVFDAISQAPQALGITVTMPDEMMHGATLGWRGLLDQLRLWASHSFLKEVVSESLRAGYKVFLTADHGNLEAVGTGSPSEGVLVDRCGQRVRIYQDPTLRDHSASALQTKAMPWHSKILPQNFLPLIHTGRGAFTTPGDVLVCHGGASLDELVVPFIEFSRARLA